MSLGCSFCGKKNTEVKKIIAGPNVFICNECVEVCVSILIETKTPVTLIKVKEIKPRKKK